MDRNEEKMEKQNNSANIFRCEPEASFSLYLVMLAGWPVTLQSDKILLLPLEKNN